VRNSYKVLVGKRDGMRTRGRPMHRWKDDIGMDLGVTVCEVVYWIRVA
jgi:hypothetical protein